ncbi:unnamed protein product, partial [Rotaria sp. Silwood1]
RESTAAQVLALANP